MLNTMEAKQGIERMREEVLKAGLSMKGLADSWRELDGLENDLEDSLDLLTITSEESLEKAIAAYGLEAQIAKYRDILSKAWKQTSRAAILSSMQKLRALPGSSATEADFKMIEDELSKALGTPVADLVEKPILRLHKSSYWSGVKEVGAQSGLSFSFMFADQRTLDRVAKGTFFWIGNHYGDFVQDKVKARLEQYFKGGYLNRQKLSVRLMADLREEVKKSDAYWDLLADHTTTKMRELGRLRAYNQANVRAVRVKARLDHRTTVFCRKAHGHVISVEVLNKQAETYLEATESKSKEKVKTAWPWWNDKEAEALKTVKDINDEIDAGNIGLPPYHARCRTITVAEFIAAPGSHVVTDKDVELGSIGSPFHAPEPDAPEPKKPKGTIIFPKPAKEVKHFTPQATFVDGEIAPVKPITQAEIVPQKIKGYDDFTAKATVTPNVKIQVKEPWQKIEGTQLGSNPGGQFIGPDGQKYYIKFYSNPAQGQFEVAANEIHKALEIGAPKSAIRPIPIEGVERPGMVMRWIDDLEPVKTHLSKIEQGAISAVEKRDITKQFLGSVLNNNWDVVGADFDNLVFHVPTKRWIVIDQGGSFVFRAQGGMKEYDIFAEAWDSILAPGRKAGQVFRPIIIPELEANGKKYISWLNTIDEKRVKSIFLETGMNEIDAANYAAAFDARKKAVIDRIKAFQKYEAKAVAPTPGDYFKTPALNTLYSKTRASYLEEARAGLRAYPNMNDPHHRNAMRRWFRRKIEEDCPTIKTYLSEWKGTTQQNTCTGLKRRAQMLEAKKLNVIVKKKYNLNRDEIEKEVLVKIANQLSEGEYVRFRALVHAYYDFLGKKADDTITLYRGIGGSSGNTYQAVATKTYKAKGLNATVKVTENSLSGWSSSPTEAHNWGGHGITIKRDARLYDDVFMPLELWGSSERPQELDYEFEWVLFGYPGTQVRMKDLRWWRMDVMTWNYPDQFIHF